MRQETGSNPNFADKKVSIQVKLGGLSFSAERVVVADDIEQVEFVIDTPRITLAPREVVSLDCAGELLRIIGKPCRTNEQSVCSELQSDIVAVMAIDSEALNTIIERWGCRASFTSPLLDMRHSEENCLTIDASDKVCYLRLFRSGLQRAEAHDATTPEDTLYLVNEWLGNDKATPIYIKGGKECAKLLRKYYKQVICE
ncbi:MAG: hypothetical protein E7140_04835 [Rikenellaceae bacterium]|nr:hypothetical protein [Rikenellaceae bacterium]